MLPNPAQTAAAREIAFESSSIGRSSALLLQPHDARSLFVLAHGAGAGMRHTFMQALAQELAARRVATFRYSFPYMERESRRPDPQPVLLETVRSAVAAAREHAGDLPLVAGGKSMGGRMTTLAAAEESLVDVRGIVLVGFPLHAAGTPPGVARAQHLSRVGVPMLFLQGTRDSLADIELMSGVCGGLGPRATLHVVEGADHSFHVSKRSGRDDVLVMQELASRVAQWTETLP